MSLRFLAVGQSFAGLRDEKSPYALKKENCLPTFDGTPRFAKPAERGPVQTDWLQPRESLPASAPKEVPAAKPAQFASSAPLAAAKPKRKWYSIFGWSWFRTSKPKSDLVQSELSLEKVRVLRNDLADSDLELVIKKKKKAQPVFSSSLPNNSLRRQGGWSELTAKLFEIGQK